MAPLPAAPVTDSRAPQHPYPYQTEQYIYVSVDKTQDEKLDPEKREKKRKMRTCLLRLFSVAELLFAVGWMAAVGTIAAMVPAISEKPLLIIMNLLFSFSMIPPAIFGLLAARRRKMLYVRICMMSAVMEVLFCGGAIYLQFWNFKIPIVHGTPEAQLVETQFGVGLTLACLIMLLSVAQAFICCREACPRRCRTYDQGQSQYSDIGYVTRTSNVHKLQTTFSYPSGSPTHPQPQPPPASRTKSSPPPSYFDCYPTQPTLQPLVPSAPVEKTAGAPRRAAPPPPRPPVRPSAPPRPTNL